jgi:hypothetical protein
MESRSLRRRSPIPPAPVSTRGRPRKKVGRPPKPRPPPDDEDDDDVPLLELKAVQEKRAARATRRSKTEKEEDEKPARRSGRRRNSLQSSVSESANSDDSKEEEEEEEDRFAMHRAKRGDEEGDEEKPFRRSGRREFTNDAKEDCVKEDGEEKEEEESPPVLPEVNQDLTNELPMESVDPPDENILDGSPHAEKAHATVSNEPSLPESDRPKPSSPALHDDDLVCQEDESALEYPMTMASFRPFREPLNTANLVPLPKLDALSIAIAVAMETPVQENVVEAPAAAVDEAWKIKEAPDNVPGTNDQIVILAPTQRAQDTKVLETLDDTPLVSLPAVEIVKSSDCSPSKSPADKSEIIPESMAATTQPPINQLEQLAETDKPTDLKEGNEVESVEALKSLEGDTTGRDGDPASPSVASNLPKVFDSAEKNNTVEPQVTTPTEIVPSSAVVCPETDVPMENALYFDPPPALSPVLCLKLEAPGQPVSPSARENVEGMVPMDESPSKESPPRKEEGEVPVTDSDPTPIPPETTLAIDASIASGLPADAEVSKKRAIEEPSAVSRWKRFRALPSMAEPLSTEPMRRLSITKTKLCIYATGKRVHLAAGNYDKMFLEYWNALKSRLEGDMTAECETILNAFLRTKWMRKLHNRLILGKLDASSLLNFQSPLLLLTTFHAGR